MDPFEFLRRDMEKISRALGPRLLPTTFKVGERTFIIGYTSLKEAPGEKGSYVAEAELIEIGQGITGGVSLILWPEARTARIDYATATPRRIGLGRAMVQAVERDLSSRGYQKITLNALSDTIPFWKRLGYRPVGEPDAEGALEMSKRI